MDYPSLTASFAGTQALYELQVAPDVPRLKLAYVNHEFSRPHGNLAYYPDTIPLQDQPKGSLKGRNIAIRSNWWHYLEKINTDPRSYSYTRGVHNMWINSEYDVQTPYSTGKAESICCGGNFVAYTEETATHLKIMAWDNHLDTSTLDPEINNWFNQPYLFWKACAVKQGGGAVINVASALDVYIPIICNEAQFGLPAELWIEKSRVQILGENDWTFHNGNVYLHGELYWQTGAVPPKN